MGGRANHGGREFAPTVLACMDVCHGCPVRRPCLRSAVAESMFTPPGIWGGAPRSDIVHARGEVLAEIGITMQSVRVYGLDPVAVEAIADRLEAAFEDRYRAESRESSGRPHHPGWYSSTSLSGRWLPRRPC